MDARTQIKKHIKNNGLNITWVATQLQINRTHLNLILLKQRILTKELKEKINYLLETNF